MTPVPIKTVVHFLLAIVGAFANKNILFYMIHLRRINELVYSVLHAHVTRTDMIQARTVTVMEAMSNTLSRLMQRHLALQQEVYHLKRQIERLKEDHHAPASRLRARKPVARSSPRLAGGIQKKRQRRARH